MKPYWKNDQVTLYCGDCRSVIKELPAVPLILMDPPYGVGKDEWDKESCEWIVPVCEGKYVSMFITPGIKNMFRFAAPTWVASYCYPNGTKRSVGGGINAWEPVLIYGENPFDLDCRMFKPTASVKIDGHSTPKPIMPWSWLMSIGSKPGDTVLDPFGGSGATGAVAIELGRKAILCEINEDYCKQIVERLKGVKRFNDNGLLTIAQKQKVHLFK
jgi:DNA modification methylase